MYQLEIKLTVLLLVFTFSFSWISEQFSILTNEKKYDFYELSEKNPGENNSEGKLKLLFIAKSNFSIASKIAFWMKAESTLQIYLKSKSVCKKTQLHLLEA